MASPELQQVCKHHWDMFSSPAIIGTSEQEQDLAEAFLSGYSDFRKCSKCGKVEHIETYVSDEPHFRFS
jgi:hypothetical protein